MSSASAVRSKIASYEAQNKEKGSTSTSTSMSSSASPSPGGSVSTARASQNRVSRMRQEQMTKDGKSHQANLVEKRKLLKERRMLQHKRSPATGEPESPHASTSLPMDNRVSLSRRTEYSPSKLASPGSEAAAAAAAAAAAPKETTASTTSPSRGGANRLSKMKRMQKMKGYDNSKKATTGRPSVAASTASTATTAVAQNSNSDNKPLQRRQRQTKTKTKTSLLQTRAKRVSAVHHKGMPATPDTSVGNGSSSMKHRHQHQHTGDISPQPTNRSFMHPSTTSPNSDFDAMSDNNYAYGATDHSVEPTTDDEATLTSVRRIMNREDNEPSPRDRSHHYQHLQAQSTRGDDSMRSGTARQPSSHAQSTKNGGKSSTHHRKRAEIRHKWPQEEKSDKVGIPGVFRVASSSDYDTDGDISKTSRQSNALDGPSHSQATDVNEFFTRSGYTQANSNRRMDDDDRTFDYGDRDDDSNGSTSFPVRQRRLADPAPPEVQPSSEWKETKQTGPSSLINKDDVEHYTRSLGSPAMRVGAGVAGAFAIGCLVLGPVGLLAGAAVVGLGVGAMQIPEEERQKLQSRVQKTVNKAHEKAVEATEKLSNSCAATYEESGVAEHLPPCLSLPNADNVVAKDQESTKSEKRTGSVADEPIVASKGGQNVAGPPPSHETTQIRSEAPTIVDRPRNKRVACLRNVRILPPGQIHGLDPSAQPKAWLDVVASANTSEEEKAEAMEEILILAKDKRRARIFLEEGVLDSLVWTLDRYFEKVQSSRKERANIVVSPGELRAVKLAAVCCLTLGKSHCAAIHTEGDLQLMSLYERGTVPEERQVAQMLHEIPHHVRITKVSDSTTVDPTKEVFALRQLSLQQAEELARSIKNVIDGQV